MSDLSILIPARNEIFLSRTIQDILEHLRGDTSVFVCLDGEWSNPPLPQHERVHVLYHHKSIGQRAATNELAKICDSKYVLKCDAHCAFDEGFDVKLLSDMQDDWTVVPTMRNLHAFDWVCPNGHRRYQSPSGACKECGEPTTLDVVWIAKHSPQSNAYCFDTEPHFRYFRDFNKRPEGKGDLTETMSLQGSCWMLTRDKYFELNVCDESFGSWGSQGLEVAIRTWLSGGRVIVNHKTWYAHMFRTQGGDFGFPYPMSQSQVEYAKQRARETFFTRKWEKAIHPLSWLIEKFSPVPTWTPEKIEELKQVETRANTLDSAPAVLAKKPTTKSLVYYTDNRLEEPLASIVQKQIKKNLNGHELVSVSLKPIDFGKNIVLDAERGILTMFKQILAGLETSTSDIVFLTEHDVLYSASHFQFIPPRDDTFYYNQHTYKLNYETGLALFYYCNQTLGLCAYRELLLEHYRKRVERVEREGWSMSIGFEPGTHSFPRGIDNHPAETWMSEKPNIDIRHGRNLTKSRWSQDQFRNKKYCEGWVESNEIPFWGVTRGRIQEFLNEI